MFQLENSLVQSELSIPLLQTGFVEAQSSRQSKKKKSKSSDNFVKENPYTQLPSLSLKEPSFNLPRVPVPNFAPSFGKMGTRKSKTTSRKGKYAPSLFAIDYGLTTSSPDLLAERSGIGVRRIVRKKKRKK